ncbi:MAG: methyltransferase family protein [Flavobacteriales bacterium]
MNFAIERIGNQLFKYRGFVPIVFVVLAFVIQLQDTQVRSDYWFYEKLALFLVVLGHLIRALTVGHRSMQTSGRNRSHQVAEVLNTRGMYSIVRHPLYLANILIWIGWAALLCIPWLTVVATMVFVVYYFFIMFAEEQFLRRKFGAAYETWHHRTPRLIPNPFLYSSNSNDFSWRIVFKNEYPGWTASLTIALCIYSLLINKLYPFEENSSLYLKGWLILGGGIAIFGLTFRYLKHRTNVFHEMD